MNENNMPVRIEDYSISIADMERQVQLIQKAMKTLMKEGEHYGKIPGCGDKKALLKSGAEKLSFMFRLAPRFDITKTDLGGGHREYEVTCKIEHIPTGQFMGSGVGSCSTMEAKYRWRTAKKTCPECGAETIIKGRAEYGGGWICYAAKGGCGAKFGDGAEAVEGQETGKIENPDIADVYNTVLKMAKKRALVDATLTVTAASDIFEQDLDEYSEEELARVREERAAEASGLGRKPTVETPKAKSRGGAKKGPTAKEPPTGGPSLGDFKKEVAIHATNAENLEGWWEDQGELALDALGEQKHKMLKAFVDSKLTRLGAANEPA